MDTVGSSSQVILPIHVIFTNCVEAASAQTEKCCSKVSRIVLKFLAFGFGIAGAVPNIPLALKAGGDIRSLGVTIACANFITRTSLVTWSYHNMIDNEIGTEGKIKRIVGKKKLNLATRISIKVADFVLAFFAQTPRAYISYTYNNNNIIYPILTYLSLTAIPAYSLDLSFSAISELKNRSKFECLLDKIKKNMRKHIQNCRKKIIQLPANQRQALLTSLDVMGDPSEESAVVNLMTKVYREGDLPPKTKTLSEKVRSVASRGLSGLTTLATVSAQTGLYFWVGVQASKSVFDNDYFAYTVGAVIILSNIFLSTKVMYTRSKKLSDQLLFKPKQILTGDAVPSAIMPVRRAITGAAALVVATFSTATQYQNALDYFDGPLESIMKVLVPLSMFLLGHQAISDLVDESCKLQISRCSHSKTDRKLLKLDNKLQKFDFIIDKMSYKNFAELLLTLPDDTYSELIEGKITKDKNKVSKKDLENYLNHDPQSIEMPEVDD